MRELFTNQSLVIPVGQAASGIAGRARTLKVLRGRAWITVEGTLHDYWLFAGETFDIMPGRLVVVEADGAGDVEAMIERTPSIAGLPAVPWQRIAQHVAQRIGYKVIAKTATQHCATPAQSQKLKRCA